MGGYLVIVTDTDTETPIAGATVTLRKDDTIGIRLPNGRLLDYGNQTTVTVKLVKDKSPVVDMFLTVTDRNKNHAADTTDKTGQITVPDSRSETDKNGNATVDGKNEDGDRITLTVKVEHTENGRPIEHAQVLGAKSAALRFRQSGENYTHSLAPRLQTEPAALGFGLVIVLPDGIDMDAEHRITVTVTDNRKNPQKGMNVTVQDDLSGKERGETDGNGKLTVPEAAETVLHRAYIVFTGLTNTIDFFDTVRKRRNCFSGDEYIVVIGVLDMRGKRICKNKFISFIDKNNAIFHDRKLGFPVASGKNDTFFVRMQLNTTGRTIFIIFLNHIDESRFSRSAITADDRKISADCKVVSNTLVLYRNSVRSYHI